MTCVPILYSFRFFLMYLINKDETEYTGQVGCSIITWLSSFPCTPPVHLVDYWIPELAVLIIKLYSNLFQLEHVFRLSFKNQIGPDRHIMMVIVPARPLIILRKHPMWIMVEAIKCLRPSLYLVKTFLHFIRATPFSSPASAACKNSSKYTLIFFENVF